MYVQSLVSNYLTIILSFSNLICWQRIINLSILDDGRNLSAKGARGSAKERRKPNFDEDDEPYKLSNQQEVGKLPWLLYSDEDKFPVTLILNYCILPVATRISSGSI